MANLAISYSSLYQARDDLHRLADQFGPQIKSTLFAQIGGTQLKRIPGVGSTDDRDEALGLVGAQRVAEAIQFLYDQVKGTMDDAGPHLERIGDLFGSVADAFFEADAQLATSLSLAALEASQANWAAEKELWDHTCGDKASDPAVTCDGTLTEPPDKPPTKVSVKTEDGAGELTTEVTTDDSGAVVEKTVARYDGHEWTVVTTYEGDHGSYTRETTAVDGSITKEVVKLKADGSGTMTHFDADGYVTNYVREDADGEWTIVGKTAEQQAKEEASKRANEQMRWQHYY